MTRKTINPNWFFIAALTAFVVVHSASAIAQRVTGHPTQAQIDTTISLFRRAMDKGGIQGTSEEIRRCYDRADVVPAALANCMLWDIAAMKLDVAMRKIFTAQGVDAGPPPPFLTPRAFDARLQTYGVLAFGSDQTAITRYFGNAPDKVVQGLSKR